MTDHGGVPVECQTVRARYATGPREQKHLEAQPVDREHLAQATRSGHAVDSGNGCQAICLRTGSYKWSVTMRRRHRVPLTYFGHISTGGGPARG
jgi:hypothetical protein